MKAILLAAGLGTRLRPLTDHLPKCMVPVAGKPILQHNIEWLRSQGITELVVNLHYHADEVTSALGDGSSLGVRIHYSREPEIMGTAGAVWAARRFLSMEPFLVLYADNFIACRFDRFCASHSRHGATLTMALFHREDVSASGVVGLAESGRIFAFKEKPAPGEVLSHWVNAGLFLCEPHVLDFIPQDRFSDFGHEVLPSMLAAGELLFGYPLGPGETLYWIDTPDDLARTEQVLREKDIG
jgi:mannose-1-phosphate guanylyltransferase